jgi:ABC-type polysaccharide/polyol phosphate export permease
MTSLTELRSSRDLFVNLTLRELRSKYKRSVLGWAWSLLNPLAIMGIFTLVFSVLLKIDQPAGNPSGLHIFALLLLCGILPWNYLANSMNGGMFALVGNANLVKKVYFPREILVAANIASWLFSLFIELGLLLVALLAVGNMVLPWLPLVIVVIVLETAFVLGLGFLFAVANVHFRDTQYLVGIIVQLWFYATPIIYSADQARSGLGARWFALYKLNPMYSFVTAYRNLLYDLRFPAAETWVAMVVWAVVSLTLGLWVFSRAEPKLAEEL